MQARAFLQKRALLLSIKIWPGRKRERGSSIDSSSMGDKFVDVNIWPGPFQLVQDKDPSLLLLKKDRALLAGKSPVSEALLIISIAVKGSGVSRDRAPLRKDSLKDFLMRISPCFWKRG